MQIPTEDDWHSEEWCDDTPWAYKHFYGKTIEEAVELFTENALGYFEDVMFMPSRVFGYYLTAYANYLMSDAARGDSDAANGFISLIDARATDKPADLARVWPEVEPVLRRLAERQSDFDADWLIYGSFRSRIHEIVLRGFHVSFDTARPETVPESVTMWDMAYGVTRCLPLAVAVQVLRNSGIGLLDATSRKQDIIRVLGMPTESGGGHHLSYGHIPDWIKYERSGCVIRFSFDGDSVEDVMFMQPTKTPSTVENTIDQLLCLFGFGGIPFRLTCSCLKFSTSPRCHPREPLSSRPRKPRTRMPNGMHFSRLPLPLKNRARPFVPTGTGLATTMRRLEVEVRSRRKASLAVHDAQAISSGSRGTGESR